MPIFRNNSSLIEEFSEETLARGAEDARKGNIEFLGIRRSGDGNILRFFFKYDSKETHRILLRADPSSRRLTLSCTCAHFQDAFFCRHIWASILVGESRKIFQKEISESIRFSQFVHEKLSEENESDFEKLERPLGLSSAGSAVSTTVDPGLNSRSLPSFLGVGTSAEPIDALDSWDVVLSESTPDAKLSRPRQLAFVLDNLEATWNELISLIVLAREETPKAWTPWRSLQLQSLQKENFADTLDGQMVQNLFGSALIMDSYGRPLRAGAARLSLAHTKIAEVLIELAQAQKLYRLKSHKLDADYEKSLEIYPFLGHWNFSLNLNEAEDVYILRPSRQVPWSSKDRVQGGLVLQGAGFWKIEPAESEIWVKAFRKRSELRVPKSTLERFLDYVMSTAPSLNLNLPEGIQIQERADILPRGSLVLRAKGASSFDLSMGYDYEGQAVSLADGGDSFFHRELRARIHRRKDVELQLVSSYQREFPEAISWNRAQLFDLLQRAQSLGFSVFFEGRKLQSSRKLKVAIRAQSQMDWLDLDARLEFASGQTELPQILKAVRRGDIFIELSNGELGILSQDIQAKLQWIDRVLGGRDPGKINRVQALFLSAFISQDELQAPDMKLFQDFLEKLRNLPKASVSKRFRGELRDYQSEGLSWLTLLDENQIGGVLADDMGLGKTIQILALLCGRKVQKPHLIVAPKSLMFNWVTEFHKFAPQIRVYVHAGPQRHSEWNDRVSSVDVVLTTYQTLRQDIEKLKDVDFDTFILDEAHMIKNALAQTTLACRMIRARSRFALTGTPIENSLNDLFSILTILNPSLFSDASSRSWSQRTPDRVADLSQALRPFLLRRTKDQVLNELPEKMEQTVYCELSTNERKHYDELKNFYWTQIKNQVSQKGVSSSQIDILEALLRLRQAS
ncbi:MAG: SNF2-related protein, partial [Bdellovibrio sp.]